MYLSTCKKISSVKIFVITGIMLVEMIECRRKTDDGREENVCDTSDVCGICFFLIEDSF